MGVIYGWVAMFWATDHANWKTAIKPNDKWFENRYISRLGVRVHRRKDRRVRNLIKSRVTGVVLLTIDWDFLYTEINADNSSIAVLLPGNKSLYLTPSREENSCTFFFLWISVLSSDMNYLHVYKLSTSQSLHRCNFISTMFSFYLLYSS